MDDRQERYSLLASLEGKTELPLVILSFVWLGLFIAELVTGLSPFLRTLGTIIWVVFILDFAYRMWLAPDRGRYLRNNVLTAVSLAVPALRMFRALRAVSLLRGARGIRFVRVAGSFNRALRALGRTFQRRAFGYVVAASVAVILLGAAAILAFEGRAPGFADYAETLWWSAMMVLSVGSEAWPASPEGRMLAFVLALYGFSILGYVAATLTSFFLDRDAASNQAAMPGAADVRSLEREVRALRRQLEGDR